MKGPRALAGALRLLWVAGALALGACRPSDAANLDFSERSRLIEGKDYQSVRERWTRYAKRVSDEGTLIEAWATFKSFEFRDAYVEHFADVYHLADADRRKLHDNQMEQARKVFEFHVTAQMTDFRWNDLDKEQSAWRVALVDGTGNALAPASVESPRLPALYEGEFFPMKTAFSRSYTIRFAVPTAGADDAFGGTRTGRLILRIASPFATAEMVWRADPTLVGP